MSSPDFAPLDVAYKAAPRASLRIGRVMKDQVHIRNAEAAQLARALARQAGTTVSNVVLEALRQYRPRRRTPVARKRITRWRRLLREDRRRGLAEPEIPVEALYDEVAGLPK